MSTSAAPRPAPGYVQPTAPPWSVLALLPRPFWPWLKNYYGFGSTFLPLAASGNTTNSIQIQNDAWFIMTALTMVVTDSTSTTLIAAPMITCQIFDTSSGQNLFQVPPHVLELFGDAMQPGNMPFPYIWKPGGTMQITLVNLDTTNARNVRLTVHGFKANPNLQEDHYPV